MDATVTLREASRGGGSCSLPSQLRRWVGHASLRRVGWRRESEWIYEYITCNLPRHVAVNQSGSDRKAEAGQHPNFQTTVLYINHTSTCFCAQTRRRTSLEMLGQDR